MKFNFITILSIMQFIHIGFIVYDYDPTATNEYIGLANLIYLLFNLIIMFILMCTDIVYSKIEELNEKK